MGADDMVGCWENRNRERERLSDDDFRVKSQICMTPPASKPFGAKRRCVGVDEYVES